MSELVNVELRSRWWDHHGEIRVMALADGYAMVRRPGCIPFVVALTEWRFFPADGEAADLIRQAEQRFRAARAALKGGGK